MLDQVIDSIKNFFSSPMITVVIGALVAFIVIRFIYRKIFKKNSVRLVVSIITVCIIIFVIVLFLLRYFEGINEVYLEDDMNYVYGKVAYVDPVHMEIKINCIRSNLKKGGKGEIYGTMGATTKILYNNKAIEDKITLKDINTGDYVYLVTNEEEIEKGKLAVRAILKQTQNSIFSILRNERTSLTSH